MPARAPSAAPRTALVAGATGLVGTAILARLAGTREFRRVVALVRRAPARPTAGIEWRVVDFADLEALPPAGATDAFCALGTTRASAGSPEVFRQVDFGYALAFARLARQGGVRRFVLVSSVGADAGSSNLYLRTKGEIEDAVRDLGFASLTVIRPGLLLGDRRESRPGEAIARALLPLFAPLLVGGLRRYRPVAAADVAAAMVGAALEDAPGERIATFDDIAVLARRAARPGG